MPPVGAAIGAIGTAVAGAFTVGAPLAGTGLLASTALSSTLGSVAFTAFKQIALGAALSAISRALAPKQEAPGGSQGTKLSVQFGETQPQSFIFGTYVTAGDLLYHGSWGDDGDTPNEYYVQVIELGDWPARLKRLWINGEWVKLKALAAADIDKRPAGLPVEGYDADGHNRLFVKYYDGTQTAADAYLLDKFGGPSPGRSIGTSDRRVFVQKNAPDRGTVGDVWVDRDDGGRPRIWKGSAWGYPPNLEEVSGSGVDAHWRWREGSARAHVFIDDHAPSSLDSDTWIWIDQDPPGLIQISENGGAWVPLGNVIVDDDDNPRNDRPWTSDMVGRGVPYLIVTAGIRESVHTQRPEVRAELEAYGWYDRRQDSTAGGSGAQRWGRPSKYQPTDNPTVMIENILRGVHDTINGEHIWGGKDVTDRDLPRGIWFAAANENDQAVSIGSGRTEPAHRAALEVRVDEEPAAIIEELLKSCGGQIADVGGEWHISTGAPAASIYAFTDDDIILTSPEQADPFPGLDEAFNEVTATYPEPLQGYSPKDAPARADAAYLAEDGGKRNVADLAFPAVPYRRQVQRLMRWGLKDGRRFRRHVVVLPPEAMMLAPLDTVSWTSERYGYISKLWAVDAVEDLPNCNVVVSLREIDPSDYDWSADLELPVAIGDHKPPKRPKQTPDFAVEPARIKGSGGFVRRPAIKLTWKRKKDVRAIRYQVRLAEDRTHIPVDDDAVGADALDQGYELTLGGKAVTVKGQRIKWNTILDVEDGEALIYGGKLSALTAYEVRARYVPIEGRPWSPWMPVTTPDARVPKRDLDDEVQDALEATTAPADTARNLVPDENLQLKTWWNVGVGDGWNLIAQSTHMTADSIGELRWNKEVFTGTGHTWRDSKDFGVKPGQRLRWRAQAQRFTGTKMRGIIRFVFFAKDGTNMGPTESLAVFAPTGGALQTAAGIYPNVPAGAYKARFRFEIDSVDTDGIVRFMSPSVVLRDDGSVQGISNFNGNTPLTSGAGYVTLRSVSIVASLGAFVKIHITAPIQSQDAGATITFKISRGATNLYESRPTSFWFDDDGLSGNLTYTLEAKSDGGDAVIGPKALFVEQIL